MRVFARAVLIAIASPIWAVGIVLTAFLGILPVTLLKAAGADVDFDDWIDEAGTWPKRLAFYLVPDGKPATKPREF